jgi:hypothetical protein
MEPQARRYVLNAVLAFVPDLVVCWAAARLTDSGWFAFFITLVALQAVYLFFWFKTALWAWLLFWIYGKRQMAAHWRVTSALGSFNVSRSFGHAQDRFHGCTRKIKASTRTR